MASDRLGARAGGLTVPNGAPGRASEAGGAGSGEECCSKQTLDWVRLPHRRKPWSHLRRSRATHPR
jgi:hypothetical protein